MLVVGDREARDGNGVGARTIGRRSRCVNTRAFIAAAHAEIESKGRQLGKADAA